MQYVHGHCMVHCRGQEVYPNLADPVTVQADTSGVGSWTLGAAVEILDTPTEYSWVLTGVDINSISSNGYYQMNIYCDGTLRSSFSFSKSDNHDSVSVSFVSSSLIKKNTTVTVRLASSNNDSETCVIKLWGMRC